MSIPDELIKLADEITLGDLLACKLTQDAAIRALNNVRGAMMAHPLVPRSAEEAETEVLLNRIYHAIPIETVNRAYEAGRALHEAKLARRPYRGNDFTVPARVERPVA